MYVSSQVREVSSRNQAEEILRIFIFQDVKKAKFSTTVPISKGPQSQFLIDFLF